MRVSAAAALALLAGAAGTAGAAAQTPAAAFPPRVGAVADGTGTLEARALGRRFAEAVGDPYRLEGLVLVLDACGADTDRILDRALVHYGLSPRLGEMADDAVAWLVCADDGTARFAYAVRNPYAAWLDPGAVEAAMAGALADGGAAAAVEAGIAAMAAALAPAPRPTPLASAPAVEEADDPGAPRAGAGALLLLAVLGLGAGAWRWRAARRAPTAAGDWLPRLAEIAARSEALRPEVAGDAPRLARLVQRCEPLGEAARVALYRRHDGMARRLAELERHLVAETGPLAERGAVDDEAPEVRERREALIVAYESLRAYVERLDRESAHAEELATHAPEALEAAGAALDAARERYALAAAALGDDPRLALPDGDAAFDLPAGWLERGRRRLAGGAHLQAGRDAEDASDLARRIARAAEGMGAADRRIARAAAALRGAGEVAPEELAGARGAGAEAEAVLEEAAALLRASLAAAEPELGADPAAGLAANLLDVETSLERVDALCDGLERRLERLATAAAAAPDALAAASAALRGLAERAVDRPAGAAPAAARPLVPGAAREPAGEGGSDPAAEAAVRAEDRLVAAEALLASDPPRPTAALRRVLEAERWIVEAGGERRGWRLDGRRRRNLAEAVLDEVEQDLAVRLAHHRADAGSVAVRRSEDAASALRAARAAHGGEGGARQRLRALLGAAAAAVAVAEEALARLAADHAKAERPRSAVRPALGAAVPRPMASRRGPFPGRFGDWPSAGRVAPKVRSARWGALPADDAGAQSWGAGLAGW